MTLLSADRWASNAELIAEVAELYLDPAKTYLDCTYGRGVWWQRWNPDLLWASDLELPRDRHGEPLELPPWVRFRRDDFTRLHWPEGSFDVVAYDPPYAAQGGRESSTLQDYNARYGRGSVPMDASGVQATIDRGLEQVHRVLVPGGLALVKCANYVWSGRLWPGALFTWQHAENLGFVTVAAFQHVGSVRPQPARTRRCSDCKGSGSAPALTRQVCGECGGAGRVASGQRSPRNNYSTLYLLEKPRR